MKVNDPNSAGISSPGIGRTQETDGSSRAKQKGTQSVNSGTTDYVQLSNLSSNLRAEETESPERTDRLEQLSAAVQAGTYKADPIAVSKSIIDDAIQES